MVNVLQCYHHIAIRIPSDLLWLYVTVQHSNAMQTMSGTNQRQGKLKNITSLNFVFWLACERFKWGDPEIWESGRQGFEMGTPCSRPLTPPRVGVTAYRAGWPGANAPF